MKEMKGIKCTIIIIEELGAKTAKVTILDQPWQNLQIIYFPAMLQ